MMKTFMEYTHGVTAQLSMSDKREPDLQDTDLNTVPDILLALEWIAFWILEGAWRILRTTVHYLLVLVYWSGGQKVPSVRDPILLMSATELAKQIRERKLTSECVIRTFIDRILEVEPFINATVDRRFNDALKEAKEVDAFIASKTVSAERLATDKPLLGVPFTVKVIFAVKGLRSTGGSCLFKDKRAQEDAEIVALVKNAGAIVLATTNIPEMGMNYETSNYLHGTTRNPYDTSKITGGSSGGEGAILAAAGSVIGVGNDLSGSIRVPCMFCGIFGHKPTRDLVPISGSFPTPIGKSNRLFCAGPMCRYATDLVTMMKILAVPGENKNMFGKKIAFEGVKVYYLSSFGKGMPLVEEVDPEIMDGVEKAASYFETKYGSTVKEINIPLFKKSNQIFVHNLMSTMSAALAVEIMTAGKAKVDPSLELLKWLLRQSQYSVGVVMVLNSYSVPFLYNEKMVDYYDKQGQLLDMQLNDLLDERSIIILPTLPFAAPHHNEIPLLIGSICYTSIFNVLGLPVTQCPLGLNERGLPIGVQITSVRGNDHLTIACAMELEKAFGGWVPPTKT